MPETSPTSTRRRTAYQPSAGGSNAVYALPALSGKDIEDLTFALSLGVDVIALSFVRSPSDADLVRDVMDEVGAQRRPVVAKIGEARGGRHHD